MNIKKKLLLAAISASCIAQGFASSEGDSRGLAFSSGEGLPSIFSVTLAADIRKEPDYDQIRRTINGIVVAKRTLDSGKYGEIRRCNIERMRGLIALHILNDMEICADESKANKLIETIMSAFPIILERKEILQPITNFFADLRLAFQQGQARPAPQQAHVPMP